MNFKQTYRIFKIRKTYKKNSLMLAIALASQVFAVSVDFYDEQQNNSSATGIRLRINNDSNVPINDAKLRYYFHRTSLPDSVDAYYVPYATVSKSYVNDTLAYFELSIPSIPVGFYPDMSGFSLALHDQNWSSWDKSKDYSYQVSSSLMENAKVVLLSGDNVIFGEAPDAQFVPEPGILKISGLKFSDSSWLEIKNVGGSAVAMSEFQIVNANDSAFSLGDDSLAVNEILRICQNQAACGDAEKTLVNSVFGWDSTGEAILKKDTSMVSYVAWGQAGPHAAAAAEAGVWNDSLDYFPAEAHVQQHNADYIKNTFFRLKSKKSGYATDDWFAFTSNDNPAKANSVPLPIKTSANQPVYKLIPGENDVLFSWLPVKGINSYRVIVRDQNGNDIHNQETSGTSVTLALAPGSYSWTVLGSDEYAGRECYKMESGKCVDSQPFENLDIKFSNINTRIFKQLHIHEIAARRDTRMLNLYYGYASYNFSWDKPNLGASDYEPMEDGRCWAVAIQVMNHLYGGNLTQDEIVYKTKAVEGDPLLSPFFNEGNRFDDLNPSLRYPKGNTGEALKWALHTNVLNYSKGNPSYTTVKNAIDQRKPVFVSTSDHAMVIYGYVGDADEYAFYYAFYDNNGHVTNSLYHDAEIIEYLIPEVTYGDVEMSEITVHMDSDGDGITDFEEINRFGTDPLWVDSDNDGIEDKREIYNYTMEAHIDRDHSVYVQDANKPPHLAYNPYEEYRKGPSGAEGDYYRIYDEFDIFYNKADKNGNLDYAQNDPDDDDDGVEDGLKGKDAIVDMDVPGDYTIFGREYVRINDRVECYNTSMSSDSYCNIASSDENKFSYDISYEPINIGVRAYVGNIDVRSVDFGVKFPGTHSNPILRNNSVIYGNINLYALPYDMNGILKKKKEGYSLQDAVTIYLESKNPLDYISLQNGASVKGSITLAYSRDWNKDFTYGYSTPMPAISALQKKIVHNGETYHLKDGDKFNTLRVESGATLVIEPGEMYVDEKLQIESNSTVRFAEPGKGTVLHTNGDIIWRAYNSEPASNSQYWRSVARGFKLVHHSSKGFYIRSVWGGTIYAPKASVVMGQVSKVVYGRILARNVTIHQNTKVYRVDFNPTDASQVAYAF